MESFVLICLSVLLLMGVTALFVQVGKRAKQETRDAAAFCQTSAYHRFHQLLKEKRHTDIDTIVIAPGVITVRYVQPFLENTVLPLDFRGHRLYAKAQLHAVSLVCQQEMDELMDQAKYQLTKTSVMLKNGEKSCHYIYNMRPDYKDGINRVRYDSQRQKAA